MKTLKILLLEDDMMMVKNLKLSLHKEGFQIARTCRTVEEAQKALEYEMFDLALIDVKLENGRTGIELAEHINESEIKIPFVFLTSHQEDTIFYQAKKTLPAAYLVKPFRERELCFQLRLAYDNYIQSNDSKVDMNKPYIFLSTASGIKKIDKKNVICLKANKASTYIYLNNQGVPEYISVHLGYLAQFFTNSNFEKISRSAIINLDYLDEVQKTKAILKSCKGEIMSLQISASSEFYRKIQNQTIRKPRG